jgi:hypothetical protein
MRKRLTVIAAAVAATALVPLATGVARADSAPSSCEIAYNGGKAAGGFAWSGGNTLDWVHLTAQDYTADGFSPAVRLVTERSDGSTHSWPWHHNAKGAGTTGSLDTTATDSGGIIAALVQGSLYKDGHAQGPVCSGAPVRYH